MDAATRRDLIAQYEGGYQRVSEALQGIAEGDFDQHLPGKWSIRQIVHHLADSEMVAAVRLRRLVAEDRPGIRTTDFTGYGRRLFYDRPVQSSLELFRAVRTSTSEIIRRMSEQDWTREGMHSETGRFTPEKWLEIFAKHAATHAEQIARTKAAGKK